MPSASNAAKMTLEERLVQHIKEVGLGLLINDEDAITELTRRAIEQALMQPRTVEQGYSRVTKDSPVVQAAREIAVAAAEKVKDQMVSNLLADEGIKEAFRVAFVASIPIMISSVGHSFLSNVLQDASSKAIVNLQGMIQNGHIFGPSGKPIGS